MDDVDVTVGVRLALDMVLRSFEPDGEFDQLVAAVGPLDPGAFLIGVQSCSCALSGIDVIELLTHPLIGPIYEEYVDRVRTMVASRGRDPDEPLFETPKLDERMRKGQAPL